MPILPRRALLAAGLVPLAARAQPAGGAPAGDMPTWVPTRTVRIVVPFPPGGSADVQARLIAERLAPALGQPVVIDNRPGAGGNIGAAEAAHAPPDGHTLFMGTTGTQAANRWLYPRLGFDAATDFAPITLVTDYPQAVVVGAWLADRTFAGLLAALRARAEPAAYGSSGSGSPTHLAGVLFTRVLGIPLVHVPYRGQGPALNDLIGGQLDLMFPSVADVLGQLGAGRVAALAVLHPTRMAVVPAVPSTAELGQPELISSIWAALYVRAGSPPAAIARLNAEVVRILRLPEIHDRLEADGFEVRPGTPESLAALQTAETARWGAVIREAGARAD